MGSSPEKPFVNPYASTVTSHGVPKDRIERTHRGPALYIAGGGLPGLLVAIPSLMAYSVIGLLAISIGCMVGGLIFRLIAKNGRHDSTVRWRQIIAYSFIAVVPPTVFSWIAAEDGHKIPYTIIVFSVGISVAAGIFVSGTRRI